MAYVSQGHVFCMSEGKAHNSDGSQAALRLEHVAETEKNQRGPECKWSLEMIGNPKPFQAESEDLSG